MKLGGREPGQGSGPRPAPRVFVALGSNLGNPQDILNRALMRLGTEAAGPLHVSSFWRTSPVDCPPGSPDFLNAVVELSPREGETPESLLEKLQRLEREFGRKPKLVPNEPRPLDLDLIAFGSERRTSPTLILPHPRAQERRFVLQPLSELAPELVLPGQAKTVAELLNRLPPDPTMGKIASR